MDLEKLEARRDEIIEMIKTNNDIITKYNDEMKAMQERAESVVAERAKIIQQNNVNLGALTEVNSFIEGIKKNEEEVKDEVVEDTKDKKSKSK
ncbi:MAG: hypothetical protein KKH44_08395 [Bacteroidetes bacterium]|nr:hypothetical protein [Bacteroidota bacterium]